MKKICVVTATRAEYGLLRLIIQHIMCNKELELCLVVTGSHLSKDYGYTVKEIENDGFPITEKIDILHSTETEVDICKIMGQANILFGEMYQRQKPDILVVLGDRYELLPICSSAMIFNIPIAHISGGEITEGVIDDSIRHCITKMSYLHFPGCEQYRKRIIQLGEEPCRVFNFGDIGVENVKKMEYLSRLELENFLGISLNTPYASVTFHPVTLDKNSAEKQMLSLIDALKKYPEINFIVTMANADLEGKKINDIVIKNSKLNNNIYCFSSLGIQKYLSLIKYSEFVIGNSSSGIVEAPCFGIPTINIGDRQKGRLRAQSIIDCKPDTISIQNSIDKAMSAEFKKVAKKAKNPYGDGDTSEEIVNTIKNFLIKKERYIQKKFYDIKGETIR